MPTTLGERVDSIDMLRGFALLGIFIANMVHFSLPYMHMDGYTWFTEPTDITTFTGIRIFVEASFYPIFAMLFGYGLNIQFEKATRMGNPFGKVFAKRMTLLLILGLVHGLFVWNGDILFTYAVMGFIMIGVVRIPQKAMIPIALVLYVIPLGLFVGLIYLVMKLDPTTFMVGYHDLQKVQQSIDVYSKGSYFKMINLRASEFVQLGLLNTALGVFSVLPLIMIGAGLSKWKVFERASEFKRRIILFTVCSLLIGIALKSIPFIGDATMDKILIQTFFGGPILAAGYVGLLLLLTQIPALLTVFKPLSKAGRMSLTTYLTQSIIATTIFYAFGFGLYGKVDLLTGTGIAVGVFLIQIIFAELWLSKFRMGPIEWLWRKGTYGKSLQYKEEKPSRLS